MNKEVRLKSGEILKLREMPEGHEIANLARNIEGSRFYATHALRIEEGGELPVLPDSYFDSFGLYIGSPDDMQKTELRRIDRLRDGKTTNICYNLQGKEGELLLLTPIREKEKKKGFDSFNGRSESLEILTQGIDF